MLNLNEWLGKYEPVWLFFGIYGEILITLAGTLISTVYIAKRINAKRSYQKKTKDTYDGNMGEMK